MTSRKTPSLDSMIHSPAADRNKDPVWQVINKRIIQPFKIIHRIGRAATIDDSDFKVGLSDDKQLILPATAIDQPQRFRILEVAAGSGAHAVYFGRKLVEVDVPFYYYPTDPDTFLRSSIEDFLDDDHDKNGSLSLKSFGMIDPFALTLTAGGIQEDETVLKLHQLCNEVLLDMIININMIHISPWSATLGLMKIANESLKPGGVLFIYGPFKVGGTCVESNLNFDEWLKHNNPSYGVRNLEDVIKAAEHENLEFVERIEMPANNLSVLFQKLESTN